MTDAYPPMRSMVSAKTCSQCGALLSYEGGLHCDYCGARYEKKDLSRMNYTKLCDITPESAEKLARGLFTVNERRGMHGW